MTIHHYFALIIMALLSVLLADCLLKPDFNDDSPIALNVLSEQGAAEDFDKYFARFPADKREILGGYIDRVDDGELKQGEPDYNVESVTPAELFAASKVADHPQTIKGAIASAEAKLGK